MNLYEKALAFIIALILLGQLVVILQPNVVIHTEIEITSLEYVDNIKAKVVYNVKQGSYPNILRVALIPVLQPLVDKDLFIYYDRDYPSSFLPRSSWLGIIDHLQENQRLKGYQGKLEIVNASRMREIMLEENDSVLIIPSGVFPDTVHTKERSLVKPYLENGGILVWIGDIFAYYSGNYREEVDTVSADNPGLEAQEVILGYVVSNASKLEIADLPTPYSEALALKYVGTQSGIQTEEIIKHNGTILGKVNENATSIGMVPVGKGSLILFGGIVTSARTLFGEDFVASDIANILLSGVISSNGTVAYQTVQREDTFNQALEIGLNGNSFASFVFLAVSDDHYSYFCFRRFIPRTQFEGSQG